MVQLTRRYHFSAAHRLHSDSLSAEENIRLYGKCNNPQGHGHNYDLEVTVEGSVSPETGMVVDLSVLDAAVREEVLERFDHMHLNFDTGTFRTLAPTTENLCLEIYKLLKPKFAGNNGESRLKRVRLRETNSNFFEYEGDAGHNDVPAQRQ
jgi:6-pyruvoyltetrahydropterin/6-carboxytetrahydropterin synthase